MVYLIINQEPNVFVNIRLGGSSFNMKGRLSGVKGGGGGGGGGGG